MEEFNPLVVLATAAISVVVSTLVSILLVPTVAVRQERARRREQSREALAAFTGLMQLDLLRYRSRGGTRAMRKPESHHGDDAESAAAVLRASADLGAVRRRRVLRRCRLLFGERFTQQAILYPGEEESGQRFAGMLFGQVREDYRDVKPDHVFHRAYSEPPGGWPQRRLAWHLWWLRRAL